MVTGLSLMAQGFSALDIATQALIAVYVGQGMQHKATDIVKRTLQVPMQSLRWLEPYGKWCDMCVMRDMGVMRDMCVMRDRSQRSMTVGGVIYWFDDQV